jgi:hypothetical protein
MAEVPVGDVGKFSKPAQLRFSSKPIPHGPSADTKIRLPPGSRSRSTDPNPSSPSHYSPSAATHHGSQAETNPHIQQESPICADMGGGYTYCLSTVRGRGDLMGNGRTGGDE